MLETIIDTAHRGNRALILFILFGKLREYYAFETFFSKANCGFFFKLPWHRPLSQFGC